MRLWTRDEIRVAKGSWKRKLNERDCWQMLNRSWCFNQRIERSRLFPDKGIGDKMDVRGKREATWRRGNTQESFNERVRRSAPLWSTILCVPRSMKRRCAVGSRPIDHQNAVKRGLRVETTTSWLVLLAKSGFNDNDRCSDFRTIDAENSSIVKIIANFLRMISLRQGWCKWKYITSRLRYNPSCIINFNFKLKRILHYKTIHFVFEVTNE